MFLVAVDLSRASQAALAKGADLAARAGADLVVLHVAQHPHDVGLQAWLARQGVSPLEAIERHGDARDLILAVADEVQPEMVILGTHGHAGFKRWVLGSVAQDVVAKCRFPVLVVPA